LDLEGVKLLHGTYSYLQNICLGMVADTCNLSSPEAEAGG
jgi:hypothetical protein